MLYYLYTIHLHLRRHSFPWAWPKSEWCFFPRNLCAEGCSRQLLPFSWQFLHGSGGLSHGRNGLGALHRVSVAWHAMVQNSETQQFWSIACLLYIHVYINIRIYINIIYSIYMCIYVCIYVYFPFFVWFYHYTCIWIWWICVSIYLFIDPHRK